MHNLHGSTLLFTQSSLNAGNDAISYSLRCPDPGSYCNKSLFILKTAFKISLARLRTGIHQVLVCGLSTKWPALWIPFADYWFLHRLCSCSLVLIITSVRDLSSRPFFLSFPFIFDTMGSGHVLKIRSACLRPLCCGPTILLQKGD